MENNQNMGDHPHFKHCCGEHSKNIFKALFIVLIIFLVFLSFSTLADISNKIKQGRYIGQDIELRNNISVSATGEVYTKPDLALTSFSVVSEAKTVAAALNDNTQKMNAVNSFVKSQGVEDKDLKTTGFNISPRYEYQKQVGCVFNCPSERVLVGYEVRQSLQVKIRDMGKIGQIIEGAANAGANQVGNLQFTVDDQDELKKQAREKAINEAKAKAKELSSQLGVSLIRITNFSEGSASPRFMTFDVADEAMGMGGVEAPKIETGENKITVTVTITYEIN